MLRLWCKRIQVQAQRVRNATNWPQKYAQLKALADLGEGPREPRFPFFSCIFKTLSYDPKPSDRFSSVVIIVQSGWSEVFIRGGEWELGTFFFSGSAPEKGDRTTGFLLKGI